MFNRRGAMMLVGKLLGAIAIVIGVALLYVSVTLTTASLGGEWFNVLIALAFIAGGAVLVVWG